jgi:hypothetical protein
VAAVVVTGLTKGVPARLGDGNGRDVFDAGPDASIGGNLSLVLGDGINGLVLEPMTGVAGTVSYKARSGPDHFVTSQGASFGEDLKLGLGDGANTSVVDASTITGSLSFTAGSEADFFALSPGSSVGGNLRVVPGNGTNELALLAGASVGGQLAATKIDADGGINTIVP